jgi:hypothetical protein
MSYDPGVRWDATCPLRTGFAAAAPVSQAPLPRNPQQKDINAKSQNVVICIIHAQYSGNNHGSCGYHK